MSEDPVTYNPRRIDVRLDHRIRQIEQMVENQLKAPLFDPFLTVKEVAKILKCNVSSANRLFNSPGFPGRKIISIGWRVRKSKLYQYLDQYNGT